MGDADRERDTPPALTAQATALLTAETPFRQSGDLPIATVRKLLREAASPPGRASATIVAAWSGYMALGIARSLKESQYGKTAPNGAHNPLGLLDYTGQYPTKTVVY